MTVTLPAAEQAFVDKLRSMRPKWFDRASCAGMGPALFYPEDAPTSQRNGKIIKDLCGNCPVYWDCLEYALLSREKFGVRAGINFRRKDERRRARKLWADHQAEIETAVQIAA